MRTKSPQFGTLLFLLILCLNFTGCLYSTHHFNPGKTPEQGQTRITLGLGRQPLWKCVTVAGLDTLSDKNSVCGENTQRGLSEMPSVTYIPKGSLNYELGIRNQWGPFPGVSLGWHLEIPTNPATMEFDLRLALPVPLSLPLNHSLSAGWGIGIWADNSFFSEYAISKALGDHLVFGNSRLTWLATQVKDVLGQDFEQPLTSNQRWVFQTGGGVFLSLPDWPLVPDYVIPNLNLTLPQIPTGQSDYKREDIDRLLLDANMGFGWRF